MERVGSEEDGGRGGRGSRRLVHWEAQFSVIDIFVNNIISKY